jgi:signal transduction histidine kinase
MAIATTSIVVLAFVVPLAVLVHTVAEDRAVNRATTTAQSMTPVLIAGGAPSDLARVVAAVDADTEGTISVRFADGRSIGATDHRASEGAIRLACDPDAGRSLAEEVRGGVTVLVPVVRADVESAVTCTIVAVFVPQSVLHRGVAASWVVLGLLGLLLIAVAALVGDRIGRSITRPLLDMSAVAESLATGDLGARAEPSGTRDVQAVGQALNLLAERIGELLQQERESVADLSHQLRTPLTSLRLAAERITQSDERTRVDTELDRLEDALNAVIRQARAPITRDVGADLVAAVKDRLAFWSVLGNAQARTIEARLPTDPLVVPVSRADLDAVIDALLGNVFHHTPNGVAAIVTVERAGSGATLTVEDAGPGMPDHHDVMTRGRRGPRSRGSGLGLDIVRRIAQRANGDMHVTRASLGGARIVVEFATGTSKLR